MAGKHQKCEGAGILMVISSIIPDLSARSSSVCVYVCVRARESSRIRMRLLVTSSSSLGREFQPYITLY